MTPEKKRLIADYVIFETKTQTLEYQSGIVQGLRNAHIIYQASSLGDLVDGFAFNLQPWAWEELKAHPEILEPELTERRKEIEQRRRRY